MHLAGFAPEAVGIAVGVQVHPVLGHAEFPGSLPHDSWHRGDDAGRGSLRLVLAGSQVQPPSFTRAPRQGPLPLKLSQVWGSGMRAW